MAVPASGDRVCVSPRPGDGGVRSPRPRSEYLKAGPHEGLSHPDPWKVVPDQGPGGSGFKLEQDNGFGKHKLYGTFRHADSSEQPCDVP